MQDPNVQKIESWNDLLDSFDNLATNAKQWIFRGHTDSNWRLETSFERALLNFEENVPEDRQGRLDHLREVLRREQNRLSPLEGGLLRHFKRRYHHYGQHIPNDDDFIEWFALMRHYGAPTRLFDWTYSFFIACYFAIENNKGECAVWALDTDWMGCRIKEMKDNFPWELRSCLDNDPHFTKSSTINQLIWGGETTRLVVAINPFRLSQRLAAQQGVFLCQGDIYKPFEDNLNELLTTNDYREHFKKFEIRLQMRTRKDILQRLYSMGISRVTLFPDLDGFAHALNQMIVFPWTAEPGSDFPISKPE